MTPYQIRAAREALGLAEGRKITQAEFAGLIRLRRASSVSDMEAGKKPIEAQTEALVTLIERHPEVIETLRALPPLS